MSISPHLTGDRAHLKRLLRDEVWPGGNTPIWQAIHAAMNSLAAESGRRVVLVVSDGDAMVGNTSVLAVRLKERVVDERFMVYALSIGNKGLSASLQGLSDASGGGFVTLRGDEDLGAAMAAIADELRHQYLIGIFAASARRPDASPRSARHGRRHDRANRRALSRAVQMSRRSRALTVTAWIVGAVWVVSAPDA